MKMLHASRECPVFFVQRLIFLIQNRIVRNLSLCSRIRKRILLHDRGAVRILLPGQKLEFRDTGKILAHRVVDHTVSLVRRPVVMLKPEIQRAVRQSSIPACKQFVQRAGVDHVAVEFFAVKINLIVRKAHAA